MENINSSRRSSCVFAQVKLLPEQAARLLSFMVLATVAFLIGCGSGTAAPSSDDSGANATENTRTVEQRFGSVYKPAPANTTPKLERIEIPSTIESDAVWGSTGRSDEGRLFVGMSSMGANATLTELVEGQIEVKGRLEEKLRKLSSYQSGMRQQKIHSKFVQADDGYLYFASMDEGGESATEMRYPTWGGNLWRMDLVTEEWEHLLHTREALIAVAGNGRYVYALGYFRHVLYQFDTNTERVRHIVVGSVGGHVSRNFVCDRYGHVFVPRVEEVAAGSAGDGISEHKGRWFRSSLVEYTPELNEVQAVPIRDYAPTSGFGSHGLVGFVHLENGDIIITTKLGAVYRIQSRPESLANIEYLGPFAPDGQSSYPSALFTFAGRRYLFGISRTQAIIYDLETQTSKPLALPPESQALLDLPGLLLYGSHTKSNEGNPILVGRCRDNGQLRPIVIRVSFPDR